MTELTPGRSFTRETERPPRMVASHVAEAAEGGSRVTLAVVSRGLLGAIFGALARRVTERNVAMEAEGLKRVCEGG